ncbi:MAG: archaellin/type IV pilin N-terminal domain-containing protein [Candidatus Nanoarchaeia archaeon]
MSHKSISPIISTILLILITIIASTSAYFWMVDIQDQLQQDAETNINENAASDLTDFTLLSVACNATTNAVNITLVNDGIGAIDSGSAILVFTNVNGVELYTNINSSFMGLEEGQALTLNYVSTYDLEASTTYVARITLSNSKTRTRSCNAI